MHFLSESKIIKMKLRNYEFDQIITELRTTNKRMTNSELDALLYFKFECSLFLLFFWISEIIRGIVIKFKIFFINITSYVSLLKLAGKQIQYLKSLHSRCLIFRSM